MYIINSKDLKLNRNVCTSFRYCYKNYIPDIYLTRGILYVMMQTEFINIFDEVITSEPLNGSGECIMTHKKFKVLMELILFVLSSNLL